MGWADYNLFFLIFFFFQLDTPCTPLYCSFLFEGVGENLNPILIKKKQKKIWVEF